MIEARFVPLERWPGTPTPAYNRNRATFRVSYQKMLHALERELNHLKAKEILIQAFLEWGQIRNDGWPRSGMRAKSPGVVISFQSPTGALAFPCDRYMQMEHNIYAVALSLEALRAVDRHGVTRRAEQYQGWKQIEQPRAPFASKEDAAAFIATQAYEEYAVDAVKGILSDPEVLQTAYRRAAGKIHPDKGGAHELFVRLRAAMDMLKQ